MSLDLLQLESLKQSVHCHALRLWGPLLCVLFSDVLCVYVLHEYFETFKYLLQS